MSKVRAVLALIVLSAVTGLAARPAMAAATPVVGDVYTLASGDGKCLSVAADAAIQQADCNAADPGQQFTAGTPMWGFGSRTFQNIRTGYCLSMASADQTDGRPAVAEPCSNMFWQAFYLVASEAAPDAVQLENVTTQRCLRAGSTTTQAACTDTAANQWTITLVPGGEAGAYTVAQDGTGDFTTVQAAIDAVPVNSVARQTITVSPGTYREQILVPSTKPFITLTGTGMPDQTVIVFNRNAGDYGAKGSSTAYIQGKNFRAANLTFANDFDEDSSDTGDQALALYVKADRAVFENVRVLGDQDTMRVDDGLRAYFRGGYVEGTVDFIYSGGTAVFNGSIIYEKRTTGGPITAASTPDAQKYGFLFYKSSIIGATRATTQLGRPWRQGAQVLYRESWLSSTIATTQPWIDMGDAVWQSARFLEYRNTGPGSAVNDNRPQLSDADAPDYTPQRYLAGPDGWNPVD